MSRRPDMPNRIYDTLIVGAGFTGIGAAIKLSEAGVDDFVILERADRVGGTWRDNTYPGAACDVPSLLYSYSFVKNPSWSRAYSPADEICRHIEDMVEQFRPGTARSSSGWRSTSWPSTKPRACGL